jgi:formylglycine-generating enzyme required for sulfatase activity
VKVRRTAVWLAACACVATGWYGGPVMAATPVVSNVQASQRAGTKLVDISYGVSDTSGHAQTIQVYVSGDGGMTYRIPAVTVSGHVGSGVTPGTGKHIVWDAGKDWNGQYVQNAKVRIVANDGTTPIAPLNMVYISAGQFQMGDSLAELGDEAKPVHMVQVEGFFMDRYEVDRDLWTDVRTWAAGRGYGMNGGSSRAAGHPVVAVNWYDAVKWCNARSEKEGLTPVYYTSTSQTEVYRSGNVGLTAACVKWSANGYRLPTEAEWEKAARGAILGARYPWGDTVNASMANYSGSGDPFEGGSPATTPCGYYNGSQTPAGVDMANGYGLYDMAGNAWEWCWDWWGSGYYALPEANDNPKGPASGSYRVTRGGAYNYESSLMRCANRYYNDPGIVRNDFGFRCVRGR